MGNGTSIGRVRGLGSAHEGVHHWLLQRFTAIGNLVLVLWLLVSFLMLPAYDYGTVTGWLASPVSAAALILQRRSKGTQPTLSRSVDPAHKRLLFNATEKTH